MMEQSRQVSHDIRSPLSALSMVVSSLKDLPEDKRLIIRSATQRINDIANGLLQQGKKSSNSVMDARKPDQVILSRSVESIMLVALLDEVLSEKRMQYRDRMEVEISGAFDHGYGLFVEINPTEFARVISNLVNNSVESLPGSGRVTVTIQGDNYSVMVIVSDNGQGIPSDKLAKLGQRGVTHGKEGSTSGSGLGLFHARETLRQLGGEVDIQSQLGRGTKVTLSIPRAESPAWFIDKLRLRCGSVVVSADDDQTIHQIWAGRLKTMEAENFAISHNAFSSLEKFESWVEGHREEIGMCLIDYEFLGQRDNGLDVIELLGLSNKAVLVTSHYDERLVRDRAELLGVKVLPKALAPIVPIDLSSKPTGESE